MAEGRSSLNRVLKFWLRDIWGNGWDPQRRALLFSHYWSYVRFPPLPAEYLPEPGAMNEVREQAEFSSAFRHAIEAVQSRAAASDGVHLTFRPIGKNIRLLGTAVRRNVERGRRTFIRPGGPPAEERLLSARGQQWSPWLWSRTQDGGPGSDASNAWNLYFQNPPSAPVTTGAGAATDAPRLSRGCGPFRARHLERVLAMGAATAHVFSPADSIVRRTESLQHSLGWPLDGEPVLGLHVRRGDAATSDDGMVAPRKSTRESFSLSRYLEAADIICRDRGIRHIFMATESEEDITRASQLRPQYRFMSLKHDRSIFPSLADSNQFIEFLAFEHPEHARPLAMTAMLDLFFLSKCQAFVGAFNSEFSLLAWLLSVGQQGHLTPYVSLSKPAARRRLHPFDALLNVTNNCPLELYHW